MVSPEDEDKARDMATKIVVEMRESGQFAWNTVLWEQKISAALESLMPQIEVQPDGHKEFMKTMQTPFDRHAGCVAPQ